MGRGDEEAGVVEERVWNMGCSYVLTLTMSVCDTEDGRVMTISVRETISKSMPE